MYVPIWVYAASERYQSGGRRGYPDMVVKSIVDIDIDDSKFSRFKELFDKYSAVLSKQPGLWNKVNQQTAATMLTVNQLGRQITTNTTQQGKVLGYNAKSWVAIAGSAKSIASSVLNTTTHLIKWTGIFGEIGGLLGGGGLWGLDKMAAAASNQRRASMGLGMSIGEKKAFDINFGRVVDTGNYLGWMNEMETDITKQKAAYALLGHGLTGNTADDSVAMLQAIRNKTHSGIPLNQLSTQLGMFGANMSPEDLQRIYRLKDPEFNQLVGRFGKDRSSMNMGDDITKKWTDFTNAMERAGQTVLRVFVDALGPLEKPIEKLSVAFGKMLATVMGKDGAIEHSIENIAGWLDNFDTKVASDDFMKKLEYFASDLGAVGETLHAIAHPLDAAWNQASDYATYADKKADQEDFKTMVAGQAAQFGVPMALLEAQRQLESSGSMDPNKPSYDWTSSAKGPWQMLSGTMNDMGVKSGDIVSEAYGAAKYDSILMKKYHNDMASVLAAYRVGPGAFDKLRGAHPDDWINYIDAVSPGSKDYVKQGTTALVGSGITVTIVGLPPGYSATAGASTLGWSH